MRSSNLPIIDIKKYGGRQVAISNGRIVAVGINTKAVLEEARRKLPKATWQDVLLVSVPKGLTVIYRV
jgi:hypothetical protein